ncbi:YitT family protein [Propionicimonas sp.]|uniref:YitT family protein n=1 Tax=Propionicimonas sp. TaxID=1955623 RepID=UPI0039E2F761
MTTRPVDVPIASGLRHTLVEDVFGLVSGTFVASLGIYLLKSAHAVTGGTAGLSLLLTYASGWSFGVLYLLTNLPFLVLAIRAKGWDFALRTLVSIGLVSGFAYLHPLMLPPAPLNPVYATLVGNLLAGVGMLMVFRHRSSLGGLNTLALIVQDRFGWRAGYVQLAMDAVIILSALSVVPAGNVALSAAGAVLLNVVLAFNHRPGRYLGY